MNLNEIVSLLAGGILGGTLWETFKFFYPDIKNYFKKKQDAKTILHDTFDSTIKAADELYGKLESLVKEDFATFGKPNNSISSDPKHNRIYILYLFAQFWGTLENIRIKSNYTSIARLKKGKELLKFIETTESRKFRILDRSKQRIIGEGMIINSKDKFEILPLYSFIEKLNSDEVFAKWINELDEYLSSQKTNQKRQRILVFGIIVASFIDHFDPKNVVGRRRNIYKHRIRPKTKKQIRNTLFGHYLDFVKKKERYF